MTDASPCRWRGRVFPSQKDAALALGVSTSTISRHLDQYGSLDHLVPKAMRTAPAAIGKPITAIPGLEGRTHQEIADILGVTQPTVSRHYAKYGHPHNIRPRGKRFREARTGPYKMGKLTFPSRSEAARCLGLCREKLRRWERDPVKHGQDINIAMARYVKRTGK